MMMPPEKLETKDAAMLRVTPFQFLESLLPVRRGWFANHALQRTAAGRRGCNRRVSWPPSLRLGRSATRGGHQS